jgi:malate dehydrogenase
MAAGRVHNPGESREELFRDNGKLVEQICDCIRTLAPDAIVINVVEPVDMTTSLAQRLLRFDRKRVLGVGGLLSSMRLRYLVSMTLGVSPRDVTGMVIGPHHTDMVILRNSVRVSGIPADKLLTSEQIDSIVSEVRKADDTILYMAQRSTAFYAPSAAIAALVDAIVCDANSVLPVCVCLDGEYDLKDIAISVPALIGGMGIAHVIPVSMSGMETEELAKAIGSLRNSMERSVA